MPLYTDSILTLDNPFTFPLIRTLVFIDVIPSLHTIYTFCTCLVLPFVNI